MVKMWDLGIWGFRRAGLGAGLRVGVGGKVVGGRWEGGRREGGRWKVKM